MNVFHECINLMMETQYITYKKVWSWCKMQYIYETFLDFSDTASIIFDN